MYSSLVRAVQQIARLRYRRRNTILVLCASLLFVFYYTILSRRQSEFFEEDSVVELNSIKIQANQKCVHPSLTLWTPEILADFSNKPSPLQCTTTGERNWVYTANGSFHISEKASTIHGSIACEYRAILRGNDDFTIQYGTPQKINDGDRLPTDFFEAICSAADGKTYRNSHAGISFDKTATVQGRTNRIKSEDKMALDLDIFILGFDSVSRMAWQRSLPRSHSYFTEKLGGVVLEGYNIVGDGTTQALLPLLTGKTESELPESRRGFPGASSVDDFPWIWRNLKDLGYVTQFGEDQPIYGTFTYRLLGFKNQPVDHYMRTFHFAVKDDSRAPFCLKGSNPEYLEMLNWHREFVDVYKNQRKFSFVFNCELTHDSGKYLSLVDDDLFNLMKYLNDSGHLDRTLFMTMSDHGARFTGNRETSQGRLEERNPYIGIRLPPGFIRNHPDAFDNLRTNAHRLTTPFDLHSTLREVIHFTGAGKADLSERGISLFKEVPKERSCFDAGVEPHWCACLSWTPQTVDNPLIVRAAQHIVHAFNNLTFAVREKCEKLTLLEIRSAVKYTTNEDVLKFRRSFDIHGREPDLSDRRKAGADLYLVTLVTAPGNGLFEATATYRLKDDAFVVDSKSIGRINKYGSQPHCVMDRLPHLRQFCYCVDQLP